MRIKKTISTIMACSIFLSGCVTATGPSSSSSVGPLFSSSFFKTEADDQGISKPRLEVIIPVFDPGLPKDSEEYEEERTWPELRRAEANRFAVKMKEALEATGSFGAVRVTPDERATGDLYILGKIQESNGEEAEIDIQVVDISGREWFDDSYGITVKEGFHKNLRNAGKDPYDPMFDEAAQNIAEELKYHAAKDLQDLQDLTDIRFGASFSEDAFARYMQMEKGITTLTSKPSDDDPMLVRTKAIRVRDQLYVDNLQSKYVAFSNQMEASYLVWQEKALEEVIAEREANREATAEALGGVFLIGLAVTAAVLGARSESYSGEAAGITGAAVGGVAGATLLKSSFQTSATAKVHREALNELGESIDVELAPQVIEFEKQTVELVGDAKEQFAQWREFLQKIYMQELTPETQL